MVEKSGGEVSLSALEYRLLLIFINNPNVIITRDRLLDELWDAAGEFVRQQYPLPFTLLFAGED